MFTFLLKALHAIFIKPPTLLLHYFLILPIRTTTYYACLPIQYLYTSSLELAVLIYQLFASFEAVFIFVATAALLGVCAGVLLHVSSRIWISIFRISSADEARMVDTKPAVRSIDSYRRERERRKNGQKDVMRMGAKQALEEFQLGRSSGIGSRGKQMPLRPVRHQTILEEQTSEDS